MIELSNIQKYYGTYHALRDVTCHIQEGEFFSLLGPSGSGKTTLLRTIAGFEGINSGIVMIGGQQMDGVPPNKRPTNMVFQSYAIFPHMSVAQNVAYGLRSQRLSKAETEQMVSESLAKVGLAGYGESRRPCAVRRATPAGCVGSGVDPQAKGLVAGRATVRARP